MSYKYRFVQVCFIFKNMTTFQFTVFAKTLLEREKLKGRLSFQGAYKLRGRESHQQLI